MKPFERTWDYLRVIEIVSATIPKGFNDLLVSKDLYATMRIQFSEKSMQLKGDAIVLNDKIRQRAPLKTKEKGEISTVFENHKNEGVHEEIKAKGYTKIELVNQNRACVIKRNEKEQWFEILTYNQDGEIDTKGNFFFENDELKEFDNKTNGVIIDFTKKNRN